MYCPGTDMENIHNLTPAQFVAALSNRLLTPREWGILVVNWVENHLTVTDLDTINQALELVDVQRLEERPLIALLRSTCRAREYLPAWPMLRDSTLAWLGDTPETRRRMTGLLTDTHDSHFAIPGMAYFPTKQNTTP